MSREVRRCGLTRRRTGPRPRSVYSDRLVVGAAAASERHSVMPRKLPKSRKPLGFKCLPQSDRVAANYAQNAIETARDGADLVLDFSESSVEKVDRLLTRTRKKAGTSKQDKGMLGLFAMMFGSYVGEVFRRHHGGKWGWAREVMPRHPQAVEDGNGNVYTPVIAAEDHLAGKGSIAEYYRRMTAEA